MTSEPPLVQIRDLHKTYPLRRLFGTAKTGVRAVDGIDLDIHRGQTLGIIGESGCGKSTVGKLLLGLQKPDSGQMLFDGIPLHQIPYPEWKAVRRRIRIIFQDPYSSIDPRMNVFGIVGEALRVHEAMNRRQRHEVVTGLLASTGLPLDSGRRYPHEFSGGQRQRIGFARALALEPELIICDEPVSALDVSIQAQVLNMLKDNQERLGMAYLFISHDMSVVRFMSDRVAVMYLGKIVEEATKVQLFKRPSHPYTRALLASVLDFSSPKGRSATVLQGEVPSSIHLPLGCRFQGRCPWVHDRCHEEEPLLRTLEPGHRVACHPEAFQPGGAI